MKRTLFRLFLATLALAATGCFRYQEVKTRYQEETPAGWESRVQRMAAKRPLLILHDAAGRTWKMDYPTATDTRLTGNLSPVQDSFPYLKRYIFSHHYARPYLPDMRKTLHIYTKGAAAAGFCTVQASDITCIQYVVPSDLLNGAGYVATYSIASAGAFAAFLAIVCSCPRVYTEGSDGPVYQGSLFPGAISRSLERSEKLPLTDIPATQAPLRMVIANEQPEQQFLDQVSLLRTRVAPGHALARDAQGELFSYPALVPPARAVTATGGNLSGILAATDARHFLFDARADQDRLDAIYLSFPRQALSSPAPKLVITGQQTAWVDSMAAFFMYQLGNSFDRWTAFMDRVPRERYDANSARRGISLNAEIWTASGWKSIGAFHYAGNTGEKSLGLDLPLAEADGDSVRIRLTAAHRLWDLNQAGIANEWQPVTEYEEVPLLSATNEAGTDVKALLEQADGQYAVQQAQGARISLSFAPPADGQEAHVRYVIRSKGYYHHVRTYPHEPNTALLKTMRKSPLTTQQLSILLDQQPSLPINH